MNEKFAIASSTQQYCSLLQSLMLFCCSQVYPKEVRVVSFGHHAEELLSSSQDYSDVADSQQRCSVELCAGT